MNLTFDDAKIQMDGGVWLCLKVKEPATARSFVMEKNAALYDCEVKRHREKRSMDANAYCWTSLPTPFAAQKRSCTSGMSAILARTRILR